MFARTLRACILLRTETGNRILETRHKLNSPPFTRDKTGSPRGTHYPLSRYCEDLHPTTSDNACQTQISRAFGAVSSHQCGLLIRYDASRHRTSVRVQCRLHVANMGMLTFRFSITGMQLTVHWCAVWSCRSNQTRLLRPRNHRAKPCGSFPRRRRTAAALS